MPEPIFHAQQRPFDSDLVNAPGVKVKINAVLARGLAWRIEAKQMESSDLRLLARRVPAAPPCAPERLRVAEPRREASKITP